ncbi:hypothetical protein BH09PSE2_BH09PSE2_21030 [soil metagenome]
MTDPALPEAGIDVIMRTGGRNPALLDRAVASVAAQTAGRIRLVLVMHGATDVERVAGFRNGRLADVLPVEAPGANRSRAMAAGLALVSAPHFALLDDDDYWLKDHLAGLLAAATETGPEPVFAYSDILRLLEGAGAPVLDVWREGPAKAPLGRITDRISVHAFLADLRALKPLHPEGWELETAEDALLIASLLAASRPVHVPGATAVYCMGRGDASAYLRHPHRARDELAFAREVAPLLPRILPRFGAEAPDPQAFLSPFLAAEASTRLALRLAESRVPVASYEGEAATPVADDPALVCEPLAGAVEAEDGAVVERAAGETRIRLGEPYAYAARLDLEGAAAAFPCRLVLDFALHDAPASVLLLTPEGDVLSEATAPPAPAAHELQLELPPEAGAVVIRAAPGGDGGRITLLSLRLAYPLDSLGGEPEAARAALAARGGRRCIGGPAPEGVGLSLILQPLQVELDAPWGYAWSAAISAQTGRVALSLATLGAGCGLLFVDVHWTQIGRRTIVAEGTVGAEVVLNAPVGAARIVLQAGPAPAGRTVVVERAQAYP